MGGRGEGVGGGQAKRRGRCLKVRRFAGEEGQQVVGGECRGVKCEKTAAPEPRQAKCRQIRGHAAPAHNVTSAIASAHRENGDGRWSKKENVANAQDASPFSFLNVMFRFTA